MATDLRVVGTISTRMLEDIVYHWERDVLRLQSDQSRTSGVEPAKYYGYLGFWIRKLKPISGAVRMKPRSNKQPDLASPEIEDINEQIAICVAVRFLMRYIFKPRAADRATQSAKKRRLKMRRFFRSYLLGPSGEQRFSYNYSVLIYDMRYRTFGPHHICHLLRWAQVNAVRGNR